LDWHKSEGITISNIIDLKIAIKEVLQKSGGKGNFFGLECDVDQPNNTKIYL